MMAIERRVVVIELVGEEREDGSVLVHSPNLPLFVAVAPDTDSVLRIVLPILKEHLEQNLGGSVELVRVHEESQQKLGPPASRAVPAHVIAELEA